MWRQRCIWSDARKWNIHLIWHVAAIVCVQLVPRVLITQQPCLWTLWRSETKACLDLQQESIWNFETQSRTKSHPQCLRKDRVPTCKLPVCTSWHKLVQIGSVGSDLRKSRRCVHRPWTTPIKSGTSEYGSAWRVSSCQTTTPIDQTWKVQIAQKEKKKDKRWTTHLMCEIIWSTLKHQTRRNGLGIRTTRA